jgi:hypothetical protein
VIKIEEIKVVPKPFLIKKPEVKVAQAKQSIFAFFNADNIQDPTE